MDVARRQSPARGSDQGAKGDGPEAVTWRLVGANNHELGRSPHVHSSLTACCAAVQRLRAEADRVTALVVMSPGTGTGTGTRAHTGTGTGSRTGAGSRTAVAPATAVAPGTAAATGTGAGAWTWQLTLDEHCVAVAVRTFRRQRECRHSLQLFLSAAAEAQVASGVTYTRRLRGLRLPGAGDAPGLAVRGGGLL
ncbi:hypothetical protein ACFCYI_20025 [Streptomyces sp. NPDC056257]|uniref:hypothetical protein n=1 Tax=Streptomyces sp. NPDC056257 TaxID=3345765 RepID=UPI0035D606F6